MFQICSSLSTVYVVTINFTLKSFNTIYFFFTVALLKAFRLLSTNTYFVGFPFFVSRFIVTECWGIVMREANLLVRVGLPCEKQKKYVVFR